MSEIHHNIDDAVVCSDGLNIVSGDTESLVKLSSFAKGIFRRQFKRSVTNNFTDYFPERGLTLTSKQMRKWFESIAKNPDRGYKCIVTISLFVMREAHMLQKQHNYPVRWFYLKADGSYRQADSMDCIGECEQLNEEVMQADRYIDMEMGLKPRIEQ
jgi:hypothetical protein